MHVFESEQSLLNLIILLHLATKKYDDFSWQANTRTHTAAAGIVRLSF